MRKIANLKDNLECLGIDWKIDRVNQTISILERNKYEKSDKYLEDNIKEYIMNVLKRYKSGTTPQWVEMSTIFSNIDRCDHHDLVRVDQIVTKMQNEKETEYQWGSLVMNFKMRTL